MPDYSVLDQSSLLSYIFYPRDDSTPCPAHAFDLSVPVEDEEHLSCRFYTGSPAWPTILYFHGNGEVVSDHDTIAPFYARQELNLLVADYRGYGTSSGSPTLNAISRDCHLVLKYVKELLAPMGFIDDLWVMGRSLGSISAIELGYRDAEHIKGLIVESGFMCITAILRHLGLPAPSDIASVEKIERECLEMVRAITLPVLIIHGKLDGLVPFSEAERLYRALGSKEKELLPIPDADHNTILFTGFERYFGAVKRFTRRGPD